ncbi:MAG: hypothetical protein L0170_19940, partial [Acidobacteria bacterium]|nr:hypothetical protein [Acidobacteriota bacterium]
MKDSHGEVQGSTPRHQCQQFASVFAIILLVSSLPVPKEWTGGAGDGKWETAGNWNPPGEPGPNDDVFIPPGFGTIKTNGNQKKVKSLVVAASLDPPTIITADDPFSVQGA